MHHFNVKRNQYISLKHKGVLQKSRRSASFGKVITANQAKHLGCCGFGCEFQQKHWDSFHLENISRIRGLMSCLSSVVLTTVMFLQVSLKKKSCSQFRTLPLESSVRPRKWIMSVQFPDLYTGFLSVKVFSPKIMMLVYKAQNGLGPKYISAATLWAMPGRLGHVFWSKLNMLQILEPNFPFYAWLLFNQIIWYFLKTTF